jgi:hypothetical protein
MNSITKNSRQLKDGRVIPANVAIEIVMNGTRIASVTVADFPAPIKINLQNAHKWIKGFIAPPSIKVMEAWMFDSVAKTVTGQRVEPDGIGSDGSPSWLIVLGMI